MSELLQHRGAVERANAVVSVGDDERAFSGRQFVGQVFQAIERKQHVARQMHDLVLPRLAHVDEANRLAAPYHLVHLSNAKLFHRSLYWQEA